MAYRIGQQLGSYRLVRHLGHGGFADVYLGEHRYLKSYAALKVLSISLTEEDAQRFLSEAQTLVRLRHPNIVRVLEYAIDRGTPVLVMDYAPGGTTRQRHPRGSYLSLATTVTYARQVAAALQYAHNHHVIHRDVKPDNILLGPDQSILLSDFGLALFAAQSDQLDTQDMAGTLLYTAPEQLKGKPSFASDQYSLGVVVYEWLCGRRPFEGSQWDIINKHLTEAPASLREFSPELPAEVDKVVLRALAKNPQERFVSVQAFALALERASKQDDSVQDVDSQITAPLKTIARPGGPTSSDPTPTLRQVFLSASSLDSMFTARLKAHLDAHRVRLSNEHQSNEPVVPGQEDIVRQAIRAANIVLVVLSPHTRSSQAVKEHMRLANMYGRRIVFVWAEGEEIESLLPVPDTWGKTAIIDMFDARGASYEHALEKIVACLEPDIDVSTPTAPTFTIPQSEPRNPYKGLRAFTTGEAGDFFGRNALIEEMVQKLKSTLMVGRSGTPATRLLTVIGPSGSGKSSVVMAGLLPWLQNGDFAESKKWIYLDPIVPGKFPFESLTFTLASHMPEKSLKAIHEDLMADSARGLHLLATQMVRRSKVKVLLVIDQFEELFAQHLPEKVRQHFIDVLLTAVTEPDGPLVAVLTLRADFYDRPMQYPMLSRLIEAYHAPVLPMELHDLRAVIEGPAAQPDVQLTFDENLVGDLLFEAQGQAGALPLLEFTLDQLFQRREGHWLTQQAYQQIDGVKGALTKHAESIYASLPSEEHRALVRTMFLRLIDPGLTEQDTTRRRASLQELSLPNAKQAQIMRDVVAAFIDARLLTTSKMAGETTIEVSHEALIREWARLSAWLREARQDITLQHTISADALDWIRHSRPIDRLYRGTKLAEAQAWAGRNAPSIDEATFLQVSAAEHQQREVEEQQRQARELTLKRQTVNRLRALVAVLTLLLIASIIFASITQSLLQNVSASKAAALTQAQIANSRAFAAQANNALAKNQVDTALLLSIKANQVHNTSDARDSLLNALEYSPHLTSMLQEPNLLVHNVSFLPDGQTLVAIGSIENDTGVTFDAGVTFWDMKTRNGHTLHLDLRAVTGSIANWALSPDRRMVAGANEQGLWLWDTKTGRQLARLETAGQNHNTSPDVTPNSTAIAFSPDSTILASSRCIQYDAASSCTQGRILLRNVTAQTPASQQLDSSPTLATHLAFSSDGKTLLSSVQTLGADKTKGSLQLWDVASGTMVTQSFADFTGVLSNFVLSPNGKTLAASDGKQAIYLWDMSTQKALGSPLSVKGVQYLAFSPDSKTLATGNADKTVQLWNITPGNFSSVSFVGHTASISGLVFSPDGTMLASGDAVGKILLWNTGADSPLKHELNYTARVSSAIFSPDGTQIIAGDTTGKVTLRDAATGKLLDTLDASKSPATQEAETIDGGPLWLESLAFNPDKSILAAGRFDGTIFLWNATTKKLVAHFRDDKQNHLKNIAFNLDGHVLATSYDDGTILLWDSANGRVLHRLTQSTQNNNPVSTMAFSPDGKMLASGNNNAVIFWNVATGKLIGQSLTADQATIEEVAYSRDGKTLASIDSTSGIMLWDVATLKPLLSQSLANTDPNVLLEIPNQTGLMFSSDGSMLAAGGDQSATVWDVARHERINHAFHPRSNGLLPPHVRGTAFSPDGQHLLAISDTYTENYMVTVWNINKLAWQTDACSIVNRNFTQDEWRQFVGGDPYQKVCPAFPVDSSVTQEELRQAHIDAQAGRTQQAQAIYIQARREAALLDTTDLSNNVCWGGSTDQFANVVLPSCDRAVTLNPYYGQYYDSRGVARALTANRQGAIDDFKFFVQWAKGQADTTKYTPLINERTAWIQKLEAGKNPCDTRTLQALRVESGIDG